jgi:hypothetical protein
MTVSHNLAYSMLMTPPVTPDPIATEDPPHFCGVVPEQQVLGRIENTASWICP